MSTEQPLRTRALGILTAVITAIGLVLGGLAIAQPAAADSAPPDPTNPSTPVTVTDDVLPTPQINGVVWSQVVVGNTVYVAGKFTSARPAGSPAGTNETPRNNLLAYDITTGTLLPFAPNLNAQALSITASPDGARIYVAGDFTSIDGKGYYRLAAFSTATNTIVSAFKPILSTTARGVTASNSTVYVGGDFTTVNSVARKYLAAVSSTDGSTLNWQADADAPVTALTLTKDGSKVIVGGRFQNLSGVANYGLGAVDANTAAILPWAANQTVRDAGTQASITALVATNDRVYGSGYVFGDGGNLEGAFSADPDTGAINWIEDCHGDTYSIFPQADNALYVAGHPHYCGNIGGFPQTSPTWTFHHSLAFSKSATGTITADPYGYFNWQGNPSPSLLDWFPTWTVGTFTGQNQATWSISGNDKYVVYGGEFPSVNGVATQGLARFALAANAPNKVGPQGIPLTPTAASFNAGQVRVSFAATYDNDNGYLTYKVYRDAGTTPVYQTTERSNFYTRPMIGFVDSGLTPGSHPIYHVKVFDPFGNTTSRDTNTVTVAATNSGSAYSSSVTQAGATSYWPLDESSGSTVAYDHVGFTDLTEAGVSQGAPGPIAGVTATTFNGSNGFATTPTAIQGPDVFTLSAWFRTTSTSGGKIIGFGNANSGLSGSYDRHIYMDNSGSIFFGVYPGGVQTLNSAPGFNDGQWHQVVASLGANGMRLYVDGKPAGARTDVTSGQDYQGYWRIGGDNLGSWPNQPASNYFAGDIGQVSIYPTVLDRTTVANQYVASGRPSPLVPAPTDAYGKAIYNASPDFYWRLNETSGTIAAGSDPYGATGTYSGVAPTMGVTGALSGTTDKAVQFNTSGNGSSGGIVVSNTPETNPSLYSEEIWFKTSTAQGGKLIGFGNAQTGLSSNYDRHIYMQDDGRIVFGTWTGQTNTITSPNPLNDNQWHMAVATQGPDGMKLYVDGQLVGTNPQTQAQAYTGYWRIGGDNTWGSTGPYFNGALDEAAVYTGELSAQDVTNHYSLATSGALPNQPPVAAFASSANGLTASFDSTGSSDPDGTIASYAWDFGDGSTGTGASPSHTYANPGTYSVQLTVTDDKGATTSVTHTVTVQLPPPNQPPLAAFTSAVTNLAATFDSTGSSDPDGTIASYAWDFGDGATANGATTSHTYSSAGTFTVTLTVTDNQGATTSVQHQVTTTLPPNQPPVAGFTATATNLAVAVNGSASSDPDGTIASYAWNFGDGGTATGATANYTYAAAGTYTITLTVTDNRGGTATATKQVTATAPAPNAIAQDGFERSTANGWGTADIGGAWTLSGGATSFNTTDGLGQQVTTVGMTKTATLPSVTTTRSDLTATVSSDSAASGLGIFYSGIGRMVGSADYEGRVWVKAGGAVQLQLLQGSTTMSAVNVPGLTLANATDQLKMRVQVFGTSPTTIRAKVWLASTTEPAAWTLSTTDSTAALQVAGTVGLRSYLSATATITPVVARWDNFAVVPVP